MMRKVFLQEGLPAVLRVAVPHVRGVPAADRFLKHNPQPQTTSPAPAEVQGMSVSVPWSAGGLPDAALLVDDVVVVVVGLDRRLYVSVGTAAEQLLPVVNLHDLRRGFHVSFLHNC